MRLIVLDRGFGLQISGLAFIAMGYWFGLNGSGSMVKVFEFRVQGARFRV